MVSTPRSVRTTVDMLPVDQPGDEVFATLDLAAAIIFGGLTPQPTAEEQSAYAGGTTTAGV